VRKKHRRQLIVTGAVVGIFCLAGVGLILLGVQKYRGSRAFQAEASTATGTVIGFEHWDAPGSDPQDDIVYAVVRFSTETCQEIRFRGPSQAGLEHYHRGDGVRVLYHPDRPEEARIDSFMGLWFAATMLITLGVAAIFVPLLTLRQAWKWACVQDGGDRVRADYV